MYEVKLSGDEIKLIAQGLGTLPYAQVARLVDHLVRTVDEQNAEKQRQSTGDNSQDSRESD